MTLEELLQKAERFAQQGRVDDVQALVSPVRARARDRVTQIELTAFRSALELVLAQATLAARGGRGPQRDRLLKAASALVQRAVAAGAGESFREIAERSTAALGLTSAAGVGAPPPGAPPQSAVKEDPRVMARWEHRRHKRYALPQLEVWLGDLQHPTVDWSIGGFALPAPVPSVAPDDRVDATIVLPGYPERHRGPAIVLRVAAEVLTFRFTTLTTPTLKVLEALRRNRMEPVEVHRVTR